MSNARQTFEAIARANGGNDFSLKQDGRYLVQNLQSRWTYFRLGWEAAIKAIDSEPSIKSSRGSAINDIYQRWAELVRKHTRGGACNFQDAANELAELVAAAEREECATICDRLLANPNTGGGWSDATIECSVAIRSRGAA